MTRINLILPAELTDQHLFAEFREIKMIPKSLGRTLVSIHRQHPDWVPHGIMVYNHLLSRIPKHYTLGKGHVYFFYNKGAYLRERYEVIKRELTARGINYNTGSVFDPDGHMRNNWLNNWYVPTDAALALIRARIADRIAMKPQWYRKTPTIDLPQPHKFLHPFP